MARGIRLAAVVCAAVSCFAGRSLAQTPDAQLTVRVNVASTSAGLFNNNGLSATRANVFARSGFQVRFNSATNIEGPTSGTRGAGSSFDVLVDRLYSAAVAGAPNPYTIEVSWLDTSTTRRTVLLGPITVARGSNTAGPVTVDNQPPPGSSSIMCYPDPSDPATTLYVYWNAPSPRPADFDRYELHRSTASGFTPSSATLVAPLPFATSNRTDTGRAPDTAYYYCIRVLDQYGAFSDRCLTTPCRTMPMRDAGMDVPRDIPVDIPVDLPRDTGLDIFDVGFDIPRDAGADIAIDIPRDAGVDVPIDLPRDAGPLDVPRDLGPLDVPRDVGVDVRDAAQDIVLDTGGIPGFTSPPPTEAPANQAYFYPPRVAHTTGATPMMFSATGLPMGARIDPMTGAITYSPGFADVGAQSMVTVTVVFSDGSRASQSYTLTVTCPDHDRDGHADSRCPRTAGDDCDDARTDTFPGAVERCNGVDDNCNGVTDEGASDALCGPGQACDPLTRTCRPRCATSADCRADPRTCTAAGVCVLCTPGASGNATACAGSTDGRACVPDSTGGVFCGCNADADCGDRQSGRVCNTSRHVCVAGCSNASGRNGCPAGQRCTTNEVCTIDCTTAAQCRAAVPDRPLCPGVMGSECVECASDADCAGRADGRLVCETRKGRCVECLPGRALACVAIGRGSRCLPESVCGCSGDADCGGATSGRICDDVSLQCRAGCRAGGNGCPAGAMCVPTPGAMRMAGLCVTPTPDAGPVDVAVAPTDVAVSDVAVSDVAAVMDVVAPVDVVVMDEAGLDAGAKDVAVVDAGATDARPDASELKLYGDGCECSTTGVTRTGRGAYGGVALVALLVVRRRRRRDHRR